jgi:hypothetical protein
MLKLSKCGCAQPSLYRRHRRGRKDSALRLLGMWPWECRICQQRVYRKDRGARGNTQQSGREVQSGQGGWQQG